MPDGDDAGALIKEYIKYMATGTCMFTDTGITIKEGEIVGLFTFMQEVDKKCKISSKWGPATRTRTYTCDREKAETIKRAYEKAGVSLIEGTFDLPGPSTPNRGGLHSPARRVANAPTRTIVLEPDDADSEPNDGNSD